MFFILSKILLFFLSPAFWIGLFLVWSFITKKERRKKIFRIVSLVLFVFFTNPFIFNLCVRGWQPDPVEIPKGKKYSAAILLGGIIMNDRFERSYFNPDADRFIQTTRLFHSGNVSYVAVSGGSGSLNNRYPLEADQLKQQLLLQGIPDSSIIVENKSRNTYENAVFTKHILDSLKLPPPYVLITSSIHIPRAKAVFQKVGLDVIAYPSAYKQVDSKKSWDDFIVPSPSLLSNWNFFLKEVIGLAVYRLTGKA